MTKAKRDIPQEGAARMERLAIQHSDDSFGILSQGTTLEKAQRERLFADVDARIVRVSIAVIETLFDPKPGPVAGSESECCAQCGRKLVELP